MLLHPTTDYSKELYDTLKLLEDYRQFAYVDTAGIATIGVEGKPGSERNCCLY